MCVFCLALLVAMWNRFFLSGDFQLGRWASSAGRVGEQQGPRQGKCQLASWVNRAFANRSDMCTADLIRSTYVSDLPGISKHPAGEFSPGGIKANFHELSSRYVHHGFDFVAGHHLVRRRHVVFRRLGGRPEARICEYRCRRRCCYCCCCCCCCWPTNSLVSSHPCQTCTPLELWTIMAIAWFPTQ